MLFDVEFGVFVVVVVVMLPVVKPVKILHLHIYVKMLKIHM